MDWKSIPILENHVMLLKHRNYVYKIKFKYKKISEDRKAALLQTVSESAGQQIEDVLRAVLYRVDKNMLQGTIQSEHFIFYPQMCPWPLGQQVMFTVKGQSFNCYPKLILLDIVCKEICVTTNQKDELPQASNSDQEQQVQAPSIQSYSLLSNVHKIKPEKQSTTSFAEIKSLQTEITNTPTCASAKISNENSTTSELQKSKEADVSSKGKGRKSIPQPLKNALKRNCAKSPVALLAQLNAGKSHVVSENEKSQENLNSACTANIGVDVAENNTVILADKSPKTISKSKKLERSHGYFKNLTYDAKMNTGDYQILLRKKRNQMSLEENNIVPKNGVKGQNKPLETMENDDEYRYMLSSDVSFDMSDKDVIELWDGGSIVYESESIEGDDEGVNDAQRRKQDWDKEELVSDSQRLNLQGPMRLRGKRAKKQSNEVEEDSLSISVTKSPNSFIVTRNQTKSNPVGISRSINSWNVNSPPRKRKSLSIRHDHLDLHEIVSKRKGNIVKGMEKEKAANGSHCNKSRRHKGSAKSSRAKSKLLISPGPKHRSNNFYHIHDEDKQRASLSQSLSSIHSLRSSQSPNSSLSQSSYTSVNSSQSTSSRSSTKQATERKDKQRRHKKPIWLTKDDVWLFSGAPKELRKSYAKKGRKKK